MLILMDAVLDAFQGTKGTPLMVPFSPPSAKGNFYAPKSEALMRQFQSFTKCCAEICCKTARGYTRGYIIKKASQLIAVRPCFYWRARRDSNPLFDSQS